MFIRRRISSLEEKIVFDLPDVENFQEKCRMLNATVATKCWWTFANVCLLVLGQPSELDACQSILYLDFIALNHKPSNQGNAWLTGH